MICLPVSLPVSLPGNLLGNLLGGCHFKQVLVAKLTKLVCNGCMKTLASVMLISLFSIQSFAWGPIGHRTVGLIADATLTPTAKAGVQQLLGRENLADVANWADSLKSGTTYAQAIWYHFEKIEDNVAFIPHLKSLSEEQREKGGMITAILVAYDNLKNAKISLKEKSDSLKFLVHFMGDLHQPFHSGRPADNGGVKIPVTWFGVPMSLHGVWDYGMIFSGHADILNSNQPLETASLAYGNYLTRINQKKPVEVGFDLERWLYESMMLRTAGYDLIYNTDQQKYQALHIGEIDRRVYEAGIRLGYLVNLIFVEKPVPPVALNFWQKVTEVLGNLRQLISLRP